MPQKTKKNGNAKKPASTPEDRQRQSRLDEIWLDNNEYALSPHTKAVLTNTLSSEYKSRLLKEQKAEEEFFSGLIKDFKIQDREKFDKFWLAMNFDFDCYYDHHEKGDDLLEIANHLEQIAKILSPDTNNKNLNLIRLGESAREIVPKLDEYIEICFEKHIPAKSNAPVAHEMEILIAHAGDYLVQVLGVPFRLTNKETEAARFLRRIANYLWETRRIKYRGLDRYAARYEKIINQSQKNKQKTKARKRPIKTET